MFMVLLTVKRSSHMLNELLEYAVKYILVSVLLVTITLCVDNWIHNTIFERNDFLRATVDSGIHFCAGLISWQMIALMENTISLRLLQEMLLCGCMSSIIDIDHFIMARSLHLKDALSLKQRPPFHCTSIMILAIALLFLIGRIAGYISMIRIGWMVAVAVTTHHLRDARRRGFWLWPVGSTGPISTSQYVIASLLLPLLCSILLYKSSWKHFIQNINKSTFAEIV